MTYPKFLNQAIDDHELLTAQQEIELAERIRGGDESAVRKLAMHNLRLVKAMAQGDIELIQEGVRGLIDAARRYDHFKCRFANYAAYWIRKRMLDNRRNRTLVRLPSSMRQMIKAVDAGKQVNAKHASLVRKGRIALRDTLDIQKSLPRAPVDEITCDKLENIDIKEFYDRLLSTLTRKELALYHLKYIVRAPLRTIALELRITNKEAARSINALNDKLVRFLTERGVVVPADCLKAYAIRDF